MGHGLRGQVLALPFAAGQNWPISQTFDKAQYKERYALGGHAGIDLGKRLRIQRNGGLICRHSPLTFLRAGFRLCKPRKRRPSLYAPVAAEPRANHPFSPATRGRGHSRLRSCVPQPALSVIGISDGRPRAGSPHVRN